MYLRLIDQWRWVGNPEYKVRDGLSPINGYRALEKIKNHPELINMRVKEAYTNCDFLSQSPYRFITANARGKECLIGLFLGNVQLKNVGKYKYDVYTSTRDDIIRFITCAENFNLTPFAVGHCITVAEIDKGEVVKQPEHLLLSGHFPLDNECFMQQYIDAKLKMGDESKMLSWNIFSEIIGKEKGLFD